MSAAISPPRFNVADADRAYEQWGANCGPGAIAAILGMTLEELRPHLGDFEAKRYTNPTLMWQVLNRLGVQWRKVRPAAWPQYGLVRVQWEGPWMDPKVPMRARYRYTHWVGAARAANGEVGVFDINAINNGTGWVSLEDWSAVVVPCLVEQYRRATGKWHIADAIEVRRDA